MRRIAVIAALLAVLLPTAAPAWQEPSNTNVRREIADLLRSFIDSVNKGDMTSLSELVSTKSGFVCIADGQVVKGHDSFLKNAGMLVGQQGKYIFTLGQLDINTVKGGVVLATGPFTIQVKGKKGSISGQGAITFLCEKQDKFWRVAHLNRSLNTATVH